MTIMKMTESFLKNVRTETKNSDGSKTYTWNCWPKEYAYSYMYNKKTRKGYYSGGTPESPGGIYRETSTTKVFRRNIFEGIRLSSIKYRINNGTWKTIKNPTEGSNYKLKYTSKKNGEKIEIRCTYELCTMGFPHRKVPFFYFALSTNGIYLKGKFTDKKPGNPGRSYAVAPSSWKFKSISWGDPKKGDLEGCWAYKNGKASDSLHDSKKTIWIDKYCYEKNNANPKLKGEGWISEAGRDGQSGRRSCYWIYTKEFSTTFTTSGIVTSKPTPSPTPTPPPTPVPPPIPEPEKCALPSKVKVTCETAHAESGKLSISYEDDNKDRKLDILLYAYTNNKLSSYKLIKTYKNKKSGDVIEDTIDFTKHFERSSYISYYAIARDEHGCLSYEGNLASIKPSSLAKGHYFNDEPLHTKAYLTQGPPESLDIIKIDFDLVTDPDGDEVNYFIYIKSEDETLNKEKKVFYCDKDIDGASGELAYAQEIKLTATEAIEKHKSFGIDVSEYEEDSAIEIWIETRDNYVNSYYRSGPILKIKKGHRSNEPKDIYPKNNSTIYSKTPRILIDLEEDEFTQEVIVTWNGIEFSNKIYPQLFSDGSKHLTQIVFRPPIEYTVIHDSKVPYSVKVNNGYSVSESLYSIYHYKEFGYELIDSKFIPLKTTHINALSIAIRDTIEAYGMKYDMKTILKDMVMDNLDYNNLALPLRDLNNYLNNIGTNSHLDVKVNIAAKNDYDLIKYDHETDTDFVEWQELLDLLNNM